MGGCCATCRHWGYLGANVSEIEGHGYPRICLLTATKAYEDAPEHPESKAYALGSFGYAAELATAPDYGCVQWEAGEQPPAPEADLAERRYGVEYRRWERGEIDSAPSIISEGGAP